MILRKYRSGRVELICTTYWETVIFKCHNLLKFCPNWAYEVFFDIYRFFLLLSQENFILLLAGKESLTSKVSMRREKILLFPTKIILPFGLDLSEACSTKFQSPDSNQRQCLDNKSNKDSKRLHLNLTSVEA